MRDDGQPTALDTVLAYHDRTKHRPGHYAASLGYLDWATQPNPFRTFAGAPRIALDEIPPTDEPRFDALFVSARPGTRSLSRASISQFLYDSLALSAWKRFGNSRWSLRVNPSSGNLHPTEGYLVLPSVPDLCSTPAVHHYAPGLHALERRRTLDESSFAELSSLFPGAAFFVGLTSLHWREAWKYGERAFRYCQHDVGHAIAAIAISAKILGWDARVIRDFTDDELALLFGVDASDDPEAEHPDVLIAIGNAPTERAGAHDRRELAARAPTFAARLRAETPLGRANRSSTEHHPWPAIDTVTHATRIFHAPPRGVARTTSPASLSQGNAPQATPSARRIARQRRSAVDMDACTPIDRGAFFCMLERLVPEISPAILDALPWGPRIHLALFVHRVDGLAPGLYLLVRDRGASASLRRAFREDFEWTRAEGCAPPLDLYLLRAGDVRALARNISCEQDIASDGAFAVAMIADFEPSLARDFGPWFYRHLHWEAGFVGQLLYLEAEAIERRGTGIGCFFDDEVHAILGIEDLRFQTIYHFTVGTAVDDPRLSTEPAYGS